MKKNITYVLILFMIALGTYSGINWIKKKQSGKVKTHKRLMDCKTQFVMEDSEEADGFYEDYENFMEDYFSEEQKGDTLIVTTLIEVNFCGKAIGDIEFSGDTLFLKSRQLAKNLCISRVLDKFTFKIRNPNKVKYVIQSERPKTN